AEEDRGRGAKWRGLGNRGIEGSRYLAIHYTLRDPAHTEVRAMLKPLPVLLASFALALGGCVGYTTYPAPATGESADAAFNSPNVPPAPDVIYTALDYAVERFPAGGAYTLNLPPELDPKRVDYIFNLLDDPAARRL